MLNVTAVTDNAVRVIPAAAAGAFALGTVFLLLVKRRFVYIVGGVLQVVVIVGISWWPRAGPRPMRPGAW